VTSYMLAAERLTLKLNDDNRRQRVLADVIQNALAAAKRAQELDSIPAFRSRGVLRRRSGAQQLEKDSQTGITDGNGGQ
jgi:hypothetical protein